MSNRKCSKQNNPKIKKMKSRDINNISTKQYLSEKGILPVKDRGYYGMYHSPFREDHNASLKVDYNQNVWYDFGTGEGGSLIDLVMKMNKVTFYEAATMLEKEHSNLSLFSFHGNNNPISDIRTKQEPAISIQKIQALTNPALIDYLKERKINIETANHHCAEIHYLVGGKPYFAVGFKNDSGGYELRNKYFKGCTSKDITSAKIGRDHCQLFEGFMDYLTFLTMKNWQRSPVDLIVLNSLTNLPKVKETLSFYRTISTFLDNDEAGKRAVEELKTVCKEVNDQSVFYSKHKDLNEYLCRKSEVKQPVKRKNTGIKR